MNTNDEKLVDALNATDKAKKIYKMNVFTKSLSLFVAFFVGSLLMVFGAISIINKKGSFTIDINEDSSVSLELSLDASFEFPTSVLKFENHNEITNITETDIPSGIENIDGDVSGENYLAYTFYIKNSGIDTGDITCNLYVYDVFKDADEAVRIKVYSDGKVTKYAKVSSSGAPEEDTIAFLNEEIVYTEEYILNPSEIKKYTVIIWLEGNDPECLDNIKGGFLKLKMTFSSNEE